MGVSQNWGGTLSRFPIIWIWFIDHSIIGSIVGSPYFRNLRNKPMIVARGGVEAEGCGKLSKSCMGNPQPASLPG